MADPLDPFGVVDNSNFDNDFEKLDPLVSVGDADADGHEPDEESPSSEPGTVAEADMLGLGDDQFVSSTSQGEPEDLYSASGASYPSEPLVSFDDPVPSEPPAEPLVSTVVTPAVPDSSVLQDVEEEPAREPSPPRIPDAVVEVKPASMKKAAPAGSGQPWYKNIDPRVIDLIYWRDVKKTGVVFGSLLVLLLSLALFSVLSVVAYLSLAALTVTVTFVVYKKVMGAVQKAGEGHPFKQFLEMDVTLPEEKVHQMADIIMRNLSTTVRELRRLFLVEDVVDSLKFGLLLWVLTYIGAWFNGMTLLILGVIDVFTLPKFYETYKVQIDQYLDIAKTRVKETVKKVQEKIPLPGKKKQA